MIKNDLSFFGTPANRELPRKNLSYPQNLFRRRPESKKTYQIARKKLFSENELADRQSLPAWTIPHRVPVVEDTP